MGAAMRIRRRRLPVGAGLGLFAVAVLEAMDRRRDGGSG
jgi:hypothetical protein